MSGVLRPLFVLVVWLALWGEFSVVNVASGVLAVAVIELIFRPPPRQHTLHPVALVRLLAVFVWRLVSSSATVVLAVLAPTPARLRSGVVGVGLSQPSPLVAAIVADAISLTPGTLTLECRYPGEDESDESAAPTLYIHVLGLADPAAIRDDVGRLEQLVVSAITPSALQGKPGEPGESGVEVAT